MGLLKRKVAKKRKPEPQPEPQQEPINNQGMVLVMARVWVPHHQEALAHEYFQLAKDYLDRD